MTDDARTLTGDLLARLERHYIKPGETYPGGVFLPEVGWNGGTSNSRADALYVGFTGSSGRLLIGHEVKVSCADWRRELDKPGKADAWADQCHAWYVVAPSTAVVKPEELPHGWGLMLINPRSTVRLDITVKADIHTDRQPSWDALRSILARADTLRAQAIVDAQLAARQAANAEVDKRVADRLQFEQSRDDAGRLRVQLDGICKALGVTTIDHTGHRRGWIGADYLTVTDLADAATFIRAHRDITVAAEQLRARHHDPINTTRERLDELETALDTLRALTTPTTAQEATT